MAKSQATSAIFFALFFCFILIASNEMRKAEAKVCSKRSSTWSGPCVITSHCDKQCKKWDHAKHGACHRDGFGFACFCYFC